MSPCPEGPVEMEQEEKHVTPRASHVSINVHACVGVYLCSLEPTAGPVLGRESKCRVQLGDTELILMVVPPSSAPSIHRTLIFPI